MASSSNNASLYDSIRDSMNDQQTVKESRVEVNQRALIDKILARYASANAVYRELIQNSNDAEATRAELYFTTTDTETSSNIVSHVTYRNNGMPFRPQDWTRLQKIAEGNPDPAKVGAFGVGAYSMFSITEEPMVISGKQALAFVWKGDALWSKIIQQPNRTKEDLPWTTFLLPSRDPYPLVDLVEFGQFLCANLTFTQSLKEIVVYVNAKEALTIRKTTIQEPILVQTPKATSWWKSDGAITSTSLFSLVHGDIYESRQEIAVDYNHNGNSSSSKITARTVSGKAKTKIPADLAKRMERVTKKSPPPFVTVQVVLADGATEEDTTKKSKKQSPSQRITASFAPSSTTGTSGRVFIGFRTSQTTGLAAHLQAPLIPTVEREAIDLQDSSLKKYNTELLQICGIVLRLTLEHAMVHIGNAYLAKKVTREALEAKLLWEDEEQMKAKAAKASKLSSDTTTEQDQAAPKAESSDSKSSSSIYSFAKFMAKGVKKSLVNVLSTVDTLVFDNDATTLLLNPRDPLPLCLEEKQAIALMQAFCPEPSTPDSQVGTSLAHGFSNCMPQSVPPVLTKRGGVVRGTEARLAHLGMEAFVDVDTGSMETGIHVIRKMVYQQAPEYHDVLCQCRQLTVDDLLESLVSTGRILERDTVIRMVQWWTKFLTKEPQWTNRGVQLKDVIRFYSKGKKGDSSRTADSFQNYIYHVPSNNNSGLSSLTSSASTNIAWSDMPMPETALPRDLQDGIGTKSLPRGWFIELPIDVWAQFIAQHDCMMKGRIEDEKLRLSVLALLCKEWRNKQQPDKAIFGQQLKSLLKNRPCLPFDSSEPTMLAAERPGDLYLNSAELKAFDGLMGKNSNGFQKVSPSVKDAGVSDEFLVLLGVRKSVAMDFLFAHLDTLQWSGDPKPLIEYLRTATLTREDISKLQTTQYLPSENNVSRTFAPRELHLPSLELRLFPNVKLLQWPSDDELTNKSANGKFLTKLGMKTYPDLLPLLQYISTDVKDGQVRKRCLEYIAKQLGSGGEYEKSFRSMKVATLTSLKIMPCIVQDVFIPGSKQSELQSPLHCYSNPSCLAMGFSVVDPDLDVASRFKVTQEPDADLVLSQLMHLVATAKSKLALSSVATQQKVILEAFAKIFGYISHRSSDFSRNSMATLKKHKFIPCLVDEKIEWFEPENVYFKNTTGNADTLTESLFQVIDFSPFLAAAGVKTEATTADLFRLMLEDAEKMLKTLGGEEKYRKLLRRIASNPPFNRITPQIKNAPFLLAYQITQSEDEADKGKEKRSYLLAKAEDIFLVDNSFFGRMFPVLRAPQESDLEAFYAHLGSQYISKVVNKSFQIIGSAASGTTLADQLAKRLEERRPLLVSPSVTSRPLVINASKVIDSTKLKIFEVDNLKAVYSLKNSVRNQRVTCCAKTLSGSKNGLYVTADFDWFDVGYAIGGLILQRCQLEDAFFIGSLLEAPLEQLRSRGFPVDRILTPPEPAPKPPPPPPIPAAAPTMAAIPPAAAAAGAKMLPQTPQGTPSGSQPNGSSSGGPKGDAPSRNDGVSEILRQMFPDCDPEYIRKRLGSDPNMDTVRALAEEMAEKGYPKESTSKPSKVDQDDKDPFLPPDLANPEKPKKFGRRIGKALSGIRNNVGSIAPSGGGGGKGRPQAGPASNSKSPMNDGNPVPPEVDSSSHTNMEEMLKHTVGNSAKVNSKGIDSAETVMTQVPQGLDRHNDGCEILPGHSLKPFNGPYRSGKTHNGVRVFAARHHPSSETFLVENFHSVDSFADVLQNLCGVYQLNLSSIAIFHDPTGGTIAFNANRALHFNVRFFHSLHYNRPAAVKDCYAYWFTTLAHELAHHLVSAHNKEHGYYTESYVTLYLPKLVLFLAQLEAGNSGAAAKNTPTLRSKFV